jgi:arylsulfatase A-like enzyme
VGRETPSCFDLRNDPDELHNLATDPDHAEQLKRLRTLLVEAQKEFDDPYPSFLEPVAPDKANAGPSTPAQDTAAKRRAKKVKAS